VSVTIVTPWQNHRELERDYWAAIRVAGARTLIVDDGSEPPLPNALRVERGGFARACNAGLANVHTDAVLFLNDDIAATGPGWLALLEEAIEPGVLVGAELRSGPHCDVDGEPMPYLDGWCLGGMTADLRYLGGWDEVFTEPSYYGDNDLCLRARAEGFALREVRVPLVHKRNVTAGPASDPRVNAASVLNRARYLARARELLEGVPA
jgi:GT2 family glycosyltransferase